MKPTILIDIVQLLTKKGNTIVILIIFCVSLIASCSKNQAENPTPTPNPDNEVTAQNVNYNNFVRALLQTKCGGCHGAGGSANSNWALSDYASVKEKVARINDRVLVKGDMPAVGSLSAKEKELLKAWFDRNAPEN